MDEHGASRAGATIARIIRWVVLAPLALLILLFVIDNRRVVRVDVPLTGISLEAPLFLVLLVVFLLGLMVGGLAAWLGSLKWRRLARQERRRRETLSKELERAGGSPQSRDVTPASPYLPPDD